MQMLPFIPMNGLNHHDTIGFYHHAMTPVLEYYMLTLVIYSLPQGTPSILHAPHPNKDDITILLFSQSALMTCMATLPTMAVYDLSLKGKLTLADIGVINWDPKYHSNNQM